jgi:hypothetical protein
VFTIEESDILFGRFSMKRTERVYLKSPRKQRSTRSGLDVYGGNESASDCCDVCVTFWHCVAPLAVLASVLTCVSLGVAIGLQVWFWARRDDWGSSHWQTTLPSMVFFVLLTIGLLISIPIVNVPPRDKPSCGSLGCDGAHLGRETRISLAFLSAVLFLGTLAPSLYLDKLISAEVALLIVSLSIVLSLLFHVYMRYYRPTVCCLPAHKMPKKEWGGDI